MQANKLADYFNSNQKHSKDRYVDLFPNVVFKEELGPDGNFSIDWQKTAKRASQLDNGAKYALYSDILYEAQTDQQERVNELKSAFKYQAGFFNEEKLTEVYNFIVKKEPDAKKPFETIPFITGPEKERRKAIQQRAYDLYLEKETEDEVCHHLQGLLSTASANNRGLQQFFRPEKLTTDCLNQSIAEMEVWGRVYEVAKLRSEKVPFNKEQSDYVYSDAYKNDRKKVAELFQQRMTEAFNAVTEISNAKTDEEFIAVVDKNYRSIKILSETGLTQEEMDEKLQGDLINNINESNIKPKEEIGQENDMDKKSKSIKIT